MNLLYEHRQQLYSEFDKAIQDVCYHRFHYHDKEWIKNTMARLLENEESETNSDSEDDNNESDDEMHQVIESVETENSVHDSLQVQQQREPQYRTIGVQTDKIFEQEQPRCEEQIRVQEQPVCESSIKMVDIHAMQDEIRKSVISEIEDQIIKQDADYKINYGTLESDQTYVNSIEKFDTFRGGTQLLSQNENAIMFEESDSKLLETITFGAQTANQYQDDSRKYQDNMKGNPKTGDKYKTQSSIRYHIEEDKILEAYVTHWQELETKDQVQQGQEHEQQDHNFRYRSENSNYDHAKSCIRPKVSSLAGV
jgi:hypothetical protein